MTQLSTASIRPQALTHAQTIAPLAAGRRCHATLLGVVQSALLLIALGQAVDEAATLVQTHHLLQVSAVVVVVDALVFVVALEGRGVDEVVGIQHRRVGTGLIDLVLVFLGEESAVDGPLCHHRKGWTACRLAASGRRAFGHQEENHFGYCNGGSANRSRLVWSAAPVPSDASFRANSRSGTGPGMGC